MTIIKLNLKRVGLCVMDIQSQLICTLHRNKPYNSNPIQLLNDNEYIFLEQIQLPRGKLKKGEQFRDGAIREFKEETGIYFKTIKFLNETFKLYWFDDNQIWEYTIYFAIAKFTQMNIINIDLTYNKSIRHEMKTFKFKIMPILTYVEEIYKRLSLYGNNNYLFLLNYIQYLLERERLLEKEILLD